jgi:hypothetical protein
MQWKSDLESLVEQTKAMVKSANLKGAEFVRAPEVLVRRELSEETFVPRVTATSPPRMPEAVLPRMTAAFPPRVEPASPPRVTEAVPVRVAEAAPPRVTAASQEREDIRRRVAGFKAHQEKLRREREQYYLEMTAKTRAMLRNGNPNEN